MGERESKPQWVIWLSGIVVLLSTASVGYSYMMVFPKLTDNIVANDRMRILEDSAIRAQHNQDIKELIKCANDNYQQIVQRLTRIETKIEKL